MLTPWPAPVPAPGNNLGDPITRSGDLGNAALSRALARFRAHATLAAHGLARRVVDALRVDRARRALLDLDSRQLRDIGLTRADVMREADALRPLAMLFACGDPSPADLRRHPSEHGGQAW